MQADPLSLQFYIYKAGCKDQNRKPAPVLFIFSK
jgi:hypothetical protein